MGRASNSKRRREGFDARKSFKVIQRELKKNFSGSETKAAEIIAERFDRLLSDYQDREPCDPDHVRTEYLDLIGSIGFPLATVSRPAPQEQWYWRARKLFPDHEVLRSDPSQFNAPPAEFTALGRANLASHPVFYGADSPYTAVSEIKVDVGTQVYLSTWRSGTFRPRYSYSLAKESGSTAKVISQRARLLALVDDWSVNNNTKRAVIATLDGLGRVFVDDKTYALSSLIAHHLLYDQQKDGIEYPDATSGTGFNYALGPAMFDQLILYRSALVKVSANGEIECTEIGLPHQDGSLKWRAAKSSDTLLPAEVQDANALRNSDS